MQLRHKLIITSLLASLFGIIMIYSASSYSANLQFNDEFFYVKKQILAFIAGLVCMYLGSKLKLDLLKKYKWIIYIISLILLALVFIPGLGVSSYGATRWINLGFTTFQPSEISKYGLMIFLAGYLHNNPPNTLKKLIVPLLLCGIMCVLVMMEPNMSITMCIMLATLLIIFISGANGKHFAMMFGAIAVLAVVMILIEPYRVKRLFAFLNPWENPKNEGYQLIQSYFAIGSGNLFGVGLFRSRQKYLFLPFAESDFIFSVIAEELGLFGSILVLINFLIMIISGIKIALKCKDNHRLLLALGITAIIGVQTLINIAVVSGTIPPTGLPLPFISAGGSALMVNMFVVGILINIDKHNQKESAKDKPTINATKTKATILSKRRKQRVAA